MFRHYFGLWGLIPDGAPIVTPTSRLLPVLQRGVPAMLKVALDVEERGGNRLMSWWGGIGAARVLDESEDAILMERALGSASLAQLSRSGHDDDASRIICDVVADLQVVRRKPPPTLVPLTEWFRELEPAAAASGGILARANSVAGDLLASPCEQVVLHGDIHHSNILDFGPRGWLAIDPKGLYGERGFEYANLFCNPDSQTATARGRLARQTVVVAEAAHLDRARLLRWILAFAGLSAAWLISEGLPPEERLDVAALAAAELDR
jgi:streptomycin 6-kinase